ncbi:MAG: ferrous iron transport protein A [Bryobacterales bacterium]|nr:ferrous iron transport protein A [Bryobacterales bacterium]
MQLSFKSRRLQAGRKRAALPSTLVELEKGEHGVLERLDLPADEARRLMELGFVPGSPVTAGLSAPGGDPRVFRVEGSEFALRRETAARLVLRQEPDERLR